MCEAIYRSDEGKRNGDGRTDVGNGSDEGGIREEKYRLQQRRSSLQGEVPAMQLQGSRCSIAPQREDERVDQ